MPGLDYQSPERETPDSSLPDTESTIKLTLSLTDDESAPVADVPSTDQIVKIDFSSIKTAEAEAPAEQVNVLQIDGVASDVPPAPLSAPTALDVKKRPPMLPAIKSTPPMPAWNRRPLLNSSPSGKDQPSQTFDDLTRAAQENQRQLAAISAQLSQVAAVLPKLDALQKQVEHSNKLEAVNQKLFDTMHGELKGYKDSFLFESLQKPVTRDLLALFDDLCGQSRRMARFISENTKPVPDSAEKAWEEELRSSRENVNNTVHFLMEILNRMSVTMEDGQHETLDLKLHKVVGVEPITDPELQNSIVKVMRPGFVWRDRLLRPTEVIVRKLPSSIRKSGKR